MPPRKIVKKTTNRRGQNIQTNAERAAEKQKFMRRSPDGKHWMFLENAGKHAGTWRRAPMLHEGFPGGEEARQKLAHFAQLAKRIDRKIDPDIQRLTDFYRLASRHREEEPETHYTLMTQFRSMLEGYNGWREKRGEGRVSIEEILEMANGENEPQKKTISLTQTQRLQNKRKDLVRVLQARVEQLRAQIAKAEQKRPKKLQRIGREGRETLETELEELSATLDACINQIPRGNRAEARGYQRVALQWIRVRRRKDMTLRFDLQAKCLEKEIEAIQAIMKLMPSKP